MGVDNYGLIYGDETGNIYNYNVTGVPSVTMFFISYGFETPKKFLIKFEFFWC